MKKLLVFSLFLLCTFTLVYSQSAKQVNGLNKLWETAGFKNPESVLYDTASGLIFVSSVNGRPADKDSNGFISTLSTDGKIIDTTWVEDIDAPKGLAVFHNHLFVTNIDEVVEIDINTAKIVQRIKVEGSQFLNDIAIDAKSGMIFITDSATGKVYVLLDGKITLWLEGSLFKNANSLFLKQNTLYIGVSNTILQADITTGEVLTCLVNTGEVAGLFVTSDDMFIYSDWKGSLFVSGIKGKPELILNTSAQKSNTADFGVITSKNMILIPTFSSNKVACYTSSLLK